MNFSTTRLRAILDSKSTMRYSMNRRRLFPILGAAMVAAPALAFSTAGPADTLPDSQATAQSILHSGLDHTSVFTASSKATGEVTKQWLIVRTKDGQRHWVPVHV